VSVALSVREAGGFVGRRALRRRHSRRAIAAAVRRGEIRRPGRDRYVVPEVGDQQAFAHEHCATLSHLSAALVHGWKVKWVPERPWLVVAPGRNVSERLRGECAHLSWSTVTPGERARGVTDPLRTVIDCARALPEDEALAVADSALRSRRVTKGELATAAAEVKGAGAARVRRVLQAADGRAAGPFESVLRAIALPIPGISLSPQHLIADPGLFAIVDLADPARHLVLEADSFEFHATKAGFLRDVRRYAELTMYGWHILRFAWVDVMTRPEWVRWVIETWLAGQEGRELPVQPADSPAVRDRVA